MILLINNQQVKLGDFISRIESISGKKVPLEQIKNNMEFTYNRVKSSYDLGQYRDTKVKSPKEKKSDDVLASFNVFDNKTGETVSFRFASRLPYTNPKDANALVYSPKAIEFSGGTFAFENREINKVVYLYCHPSCADSPFYEAGKVYKYSHNNLKAASERKKAQINKKQLAFEHAGRVDESELKVLAKGLNIPLIPNADADDIRTALREYALEHPEDYLKRTEDDVVKFDGMIQEALDTGYIVCRKVGGAIACEFTKGRQAGKQITVITSNTNDYIRELKTFMKSNIKDYYHDMSILNKDVTADMNAREFLESIKNGAPASATQPYKEPVLVANIKTFADAKAFLIDNHPEGGYPSQANNKAFLEKILSGEITDENVYDEVGKYIKQS